MFRQPPLISRPKICHPPVKTPHVHQKRLPPLYPWKHRQVTQPRLSMPLPRKNTKATYTTDADIPAQVADSTLAEPASVQGLKRHIFTSRTKGDEGRPGFWYVDGTFQYRRTDKTKILHTFAECLVWEYKRTSTDFFTSEYECWLGVEGSIKVFLHTKKRLHPRCANFIFAIWALDSCSHVFRVCAIRKKLGGCVRRDKTTSTGLLHNSIE